MITSARFPVSDHCDGRRFFNPGGQTLPKLCDVVRWKFSSRTTPWPRQVEVTLQPRAPLNAREIRATWINHSTFLLETPQGNILPDPVFSHHCGPGGKVGPLRVHRPALALAELPEIHYVLLSHNHYDHCDMPSLRWLVQTHDPEIFAPLGNSRLLARTGSRRVFELDWWGNHSPTPNLAITATPARHWSNRLGEPRAASLWGGFFVQAGTSRIFFAGDTGYDARLFVEIAARLGQPDLALIPIGAYEPRWFMHGQHCNPEEALLIHRDLAATTSLAMHWGTFQLTDEGRDDPPAALRAALENSPLANKDFRILLPGAHFIFLQEPFSFF